ncbi:MAG: 3-dehydroquinate synthase family protein, partial [Actinomycetota bacterium]
RRDPSALVPLVARAARVKVQIVDADPTERGIRAHLNYGHTLGHALETLGHSGGGPPRRHGEAVAIGMMFAASLAARAGFKDLVAEHRAPIEAAGLPSGGAGVPFPVVHSMMARDKKWDRGPRFVLLEELGRPRLVAGIDQAVLEVAYQEIR